MTKGDNKNFKNSTKCWIRDNDYIDTDINVRDHCISLENIAYYWKTLSSYYARTRELQS